MFSTQTQKTLSLLLLLGGLFLPLVASPVQELGREEFKPDEERLFDQALSGLSDNLSMSNTSVLQNMSGGASAGLQIGPAKCAQSPHAANNPSTYTFSQFLSCESVQSSSPWDPINQEFSFSDDLTRAYAWVQLVDIFVTLRVRFSFYDPAGNLYFGWTSDWIPSPQSLSFQYWYWWRFWAYINLYSGISLGTWRVTLEIDSGGGFQLASSLSFKIFQSSPVLTPSPNPTPTTPSPPPSPTPAPPVQAWINITAPLQGSRYAIGDSISIEIDGYDANGIPFEQIEYYIDSNLVFSDLHPVSTCPTSHLIWQIPSINTPGPHLLIVVGSGQYASFSDSLEFTILTPPFDKGSSGFVYGSVQQYVEIIRYHNSFKKNPINRIFARVGGIEFPSLQVSYNDEIAEFYHQRLAPEVQIYTMIDGRGNLASFSSTQLNSLAQTLVTLVHRDVEAYGLLLDIEFDTEDKAGFVSALLQLCSLMQQNDLRKPLVLCVGDLPQTLLQSLFIAPSVSFLVTMAYDLASNPREYGQKAQILIDTFLSCAVTALKPGIVALPFICTHHEFEKKIEISTSKVFPSGYLISDYVCQGLGALRNSIYRYASGFLGVCAWSFLPEAVGLNEGPYIYEPWTTATLLDNLVYLRSYSTSAQSIQIFVIPQYPRASDLDLDSLSDFDELIQFFTNPLNADTDADGMSDGFEQRNHLDPTNPADAWLDIDIDQLANYWEYKNGTNPQVADSDGDGFFDGAEITIYYTNPLSSDSDCDGMPDAYEIAQKLDPMSAGDKYADADQDFLCNWAEYGNGTNPWENDTDKDDMPDAWEVFNKLNATSPLDKFEDPDLDGIQNFYEFLNNSDPHIKNSANDTIDSDTESGDLQEESSDSPDWPISLYPWLFIALVSVSVFALVYFKKEKSKF